MAEDAASPGSPAPPTMEELARRIMDLWQEQMAAIAADPDLMRQMARMMAVSPFPAMLQGVIQGMLAANQPHPGQPHPGVSGAGNPAANPFDWWRAKDGAKFEPEPPTVGTPAAAPASQPGGDDLAELRRHLAGLEARLAKLGDAGRDIASSAGSQPRKSKPRSSKPAARKPAAKVGGTGGGSGDSGSSDGGSGGAGPGAAG